MQSYRVIHQHFHHSNLQVQVQPLPVTLDGHLSKTSRSSQRSFAKLHLKSLQKGMIWYDMIWTTVVDTIDAMDTMDTSCWKSAAHQIPGFLPRSRGLQWKKIVHRMSWKKCPATTLKPNGPVASINGWLQCPLKLWAHPIRPWCHAKHIPNTSNEHSKHLSPRPNLAKAQAKTEICRTDSEKWKVEKVSPSSSEICYCYMEWWHIPTESSTGCGRLQEINWHKQKLRISSAIAPISKIYSVVAWPVLRPALINRKTDKQTMILGVGLSIHLFVISPEYMGLIGSSVYLRISVCRLIRLLVHGLCQSACIASLVHQLLVGLSVYRCAGQNFEPATPAQCHSTLTFTSGTMWQGGKSLAEHHIAYCYCTHVITIKSYMCRVQDLWNCRVTRIVASFGEQVSIWRRLSTSAAKDEIRADSLHVLEANLGLLARASLNKSRQFRCGHQNLQEMESHLLTWKGNVQNHHLFIEWVVVFQRIATCSTKFSQEYILEADHHAVLTRSGAPFTDAFPMWQNEPSHGPMVHHKVPKKTPWDAKLHPTFVYVWGLRAICSVLGITFVPRLRQRIRSHSSCLAIWLQSVATTERCERFELGVLLPIGQEMPKKREKKHIPILQISSHWSKCSQQAKHMSLQSNCLQPSRHMSRLTWSKITL